MVKRKSNKSQEIVEGNAEQVRNYEEEVEDNG
jgi:hypothetical protein